MNKMIELTEAIEVQAGDNNTIPVKPVFEKLKNQRDVQLVYGDPVEAGNRKVIPVAKVRYIIGGGGGNTEGNTKTPKGDGGGAGGIITVSPIGVYDLSNDKTTYKPAIDTKLLFIFASIATLGLAFIIKVLSSKK